MRSCAYEPDEGLILGSALQEIADTVEQVYEQAVPRVRNLKRSESDGVKLYIHTEFWRCLNSDANTKIESSLGDHRDGS